MSQSSSLSQVTVPLLPPSNALADGEWDEDDFISLHEVSPDNGSTPREHDQVCFEYTSQPVPCLTERGAHCGVTRLVLPFYGGPFCVKYQRVQTSIATTSLGGAGAPDSLDEEDARDPVRSTQGAVVTRQNLALCASDPFSLSLHVQTEMRPLCRSNKGRGLSRLPLQTSSGDLSCLVEDLTNICALMVTVIARATTSTGGQKLRLVKPTCWVESGTGTRTCALVVEVDLLSSETRLGGGPSWVSIPFSSQDYDLLWRESYGLVECSENDRIVIKIPYAAASPSRPLPRSEPAVSESIQSSGLRCGHCAALLLEAEEISRILPLPSGLFDQVMHEYLCSETEPTMPLSLADVTSPRGVISVGEIFLSVNPKDLLNGQEPRLDCSCKLSPSLLDVVGGSLGLKGLPQMGLTENSNYLSLVDASTCSIACLRCLTVLGDGLIASDSSPTQHSHSQSEAIQLSDLQDVRFLRGEVRWSMCGREESWGDRELVDRLTERCSAEQVIEHSFSWLTLPPCRSSPTPSSGSSIAMM
jgi:hypothetical protein